MGLMRSFAVVKRVNLRRGGKPAIGVLLRHCVVGGPLAKSRVNTRLMIARSCILSRTRVKGSFRVI